MSRRKKDTRSVRRLTADEHLQAFREGLNTIGHLAKIYDDGHTPIVFLIATELYKLVEENRAMTTERSSREFSSPDCPEEFDLLSAMYRLIGTEVENSNRSVRFLPMFRMPGLTPIRQLKFREWWDGEAIYRASAAPPGSPPGTIPVNGSPEVPIAEREKLRRKELIYLLRNKRGAHQDNDLPILLDQLDTVDNWASIAIETPEGIFSTDDGSLTVSVGPTAAMIRQIAHEFLLAFDRPDP